MKDAMETITARVEALRVSKTSMKGWTLYGPVDQALKTSIQANAVKVYPLHAGVHGQEVNVELWVCAEPSADTDASPNIAAMGMVAVQRRRDRGEELAEELVNTEDMTVGYTVLLGSDLTPIIGVAILTGPGCTDVPQVSASCLFAALLGHDHE